MEATWSSEMSVDFQRTTWHYIPEDKRFYINANFTSNTGTEAAPDTRFMSRLYCIMFW
jgi:hypothetical protein